ncbi:MAG: hypothetical protein K0S33_979 [Bacteroidetes bacterium]|jgi:hypothetical protein|nr:hypothetical protein [Bacteroidota bacterium]
MKKQIHIFMLMLTGSLVLSTRPVSAQNNDKTIKAGSVTTMTRQVPSFTGIEVSSAFKIKLNNSKQQSLSIEAPENFIPYYSIEVKNNVLIIGLNKNADGISFQGEMGVITVSCESLNSIKLSGASKLQGSGSFSATSLSLHLSGAADLAIDIKTETLTCDLSGASTADLKGSVNGKMKLDVSGAGHFEGYGLEAASADCDLSGAGKAELNVNKKLQVDASGASTVKYTGKATEVTVEASGASTVMRKG